MLPDVNKDLKTKCYKLKCLYGLLETDIAMLHIDETPVKVGI